MRTMRSLAVTLLLVAVAPGCGKDLDPVLAQPFDPQRDCFAEAFEVGRIEPGTACDTAVTYAKDAAGRCYMFSSSCVPPGFPAARGSDATFCGSTSATPRSCD